LCFFPGVAVAALEGLGCLAHWEVGGWLCVIEWESDADAGV
jgi:hypothetical protein